ncbi:MAG: hypothetical protein RLZZ401_1484, partial [Pseudomonadota bacterium]
MVYANAIFYKLGAHQLQAVKPQLIYPLNTQEPAEREVARQFALREMGAAITSPLAACLLAYLLFGQVSSQTLLLWLGCQVFWALCSLGLSLILVQRVESKLARRRLMGCLQLTLLLEGLTWGAAPLLLPTGQMAHTVLVVVFLCIMCSLALHVLCLNRPCMWAFMLGLMLPV